MHRRSRRARRTTGAVAALALVVLAGCGSEPSPDAPGGGAVDELSSHDGEPCPQQFPQRGDGGPGLGTGDPAPRSPSLPEADEAWVCQYDPSDIDPGPDADGKTLGWARAGEPRTVEPDRLSELQAGLAELVPATEDRMCTADLGPRFMLVLSDRGDLTGVVVDAYGCREVRLTDEPFETVPGEATQAGTVPGVLQGPEGLLESLQGPRAAS